MDSRGGGVALFHAVALFMHEKEMIATVRVLAVAPADTKTVAVSSCRLRFPRSFQNREHARIAWFLEKVSSPLARA